MKETKRKTGAWPTCVIALMGLLAFGSGGSASALAASFRPLELSSIANASRFDDEAADGQGGWLDLGSNDLRVLPAGTQELAGVRFAVPPCADSAARTCLVLGRKGGEKAELEALDGISGGRLYLLHAISGGGDPEKRGMVATVTFKYADGVKRQFHVRTGRDVADWTSGRDCENAVRAWTAYNGHTQVSLFLSGFDLDSSRKLKSISFKATGEATWMVVAATVGRGAKVRGLRSQTELTGTFRAPPSRTTNLARLPDGARPKNVILVIGDGMGPGSIRCASLYQHGRDGALVMQQLPVSGLCLTRSADNAVTDSAAAATAFATGTKTSNGVLGLGISGKAERKNPRPLVSVAEKAHAAGRAVALVTNDKLTGATPAGFYAHVSGRGSAERIAEQAAASGFEVLVGASGSERAFRPEAVGGTRKDGRDVVAEMERNGYVSVTSQQAFASAPADRKVVGFLLAEAQAEDSVAATVKCALERIGTAPQGFFMMCESSLPDHGNHGNRPPDTVRGVLQVDWMAAAALDFAERRGDTLVVVTADHETGGVSASRSLAGGRVTVHYSATTHTGAPVALFAYGPGAERFEGLIDNTDIAKIFGDLLGLTGDF